ncbi:MAG: hypothetical protein ACREOL_10550 [Candidatus Dormibacteria bacterium]
MAGFVATFVREVSPQQVVGPVVIASSATTYASARGASSGLQDRGSELQDQGWQSVSTGRLGQEVRAFTAIRSLDQTSYESFVVEWRQDNVDNEIRIAGNAATLDLNYALTLARLQQRTEQG